MEKEKNRRKKSLLFGLDEFKKEHPEIRVLDMANLFYLCQWKIADSLQEVYEHVYGPEGCSLCRKRIERIEENIKSGYVPDHLG